MKKKINFFTIIIILYNKISNKYIYIFLLNLYNIKFNISLIIKFIFLFKFVLANSNDLTSIWDFGDFILKIVENQDQNNIKDEKVVEPAVTVTAEPAVTVKVEPAVTVTAEPAVTVKVLESIESSKLSEEAIKIKFSEMNMDEFLEYLFENEPKVY
jgi:hypothetical protein